MANITQVWDFLKQNNLIVDNANDLTSAMQLVYEALSSDEPFSELSMETYLVDPEQLSTN